MVVVAEARPPSSDRKILHATFRRSGRADAEQGFDVDYYDLHWLPRSLVLENDRVWRADLFGGGRTLAILTDFCRCERLEPTPANKNGILVKVLSKAARNPPVHPTMSVVSHYWILKA